MFQTKLADKSFDTTSIGGMRLKLAELQESDIEAEKIRAEKLKKGLGKYINVNRMLYHQELPFVYWPSLKKDVEAYIKGCNICLALKAVKQKPYDNLQALPVPTRLIKRPYKNGTL